MNCFEWQTRASDFLDGSLPAVQAAEAQKHVESCSNCHERFQHYQQIVASIGSMPQATLPAAIRRAPLSFTLPKLDPRIRRSRWERAPWFVRTGVEGLGIAFIVLFVVAMVPRLRSIYEKSIERRLDAFTLADLRFDDDDSAKPNTAAPLARGKLGSAVAMGESDAFSGEEEDDSEEVESSSGGKGDDRDVRVGQSDIWRFNIKTDSPHEIRPKIVQMLSDLRIPQDTPGLGGTEAPGGIQFDLFVPRNVIPSIKNQLQKISGANTRSMIAARNAQGREAPSASETFTWYKVRSRRKIPPGKARLVIWLSQI